LADRVIQGWAAWSVLTMAWPATRAGMAGSRRARAGAWRAMRRRD